jgi:hypothetical protein
MLSAFCKLEEVSSSSYFLGYHVELCPRIPIQTCQADDYHHMDSHSELPLFESQYRTNPEAVRNYITSWVLATASQNSGSYRKSSPMTLSNHFPSGNGRTHNKYVCECPIFFQGLDADGQHSASRNAQSAMPKAENEWLEY